MKLKNIIAAQELRIKAQILKEGSPSKGVAKQQKKLNDLSKQISKLTADLEKVTNDLLVGRDKYLQAGMDGNIQKAKNQMVIQKQLTQKKKDIMDELEPLKEKFYALGMVAGDEEGHPEDVADQAGMEMEQEAARQAEEDIA